MDDDSLTRELDAALNVDPSPEFLAKVRTRIAAEPAPSRWRLAWVMTPIAAAAVVMLAMVWTLQPEPQPATPVQVSAPRVAPAPPAPVIERAESSPSPVVPPARREDAAVTAVPEVLIAPEEQLGFEYLLAMTSRVRVSETVQVTPDVGSERPQLPEFEVTPITPIAPVQLQPLQIAALR